MTPERALDRLRQYEPLTFAARGVRRAAVLVPLRRTRDGGDLELVLTRRSTELPSHGGQVAFPGGAIEAADASPTAAALREAREELGIPVGDVELIGQLDDMVTVTGFHVVARVGLLSPGTDLQPDAAEVARVFAVPLSVLLEPDRWQQKVHHWKGSELLVWHFPFDGEDIWGATGRTVRNMVELLWQAP